MHASPQQRLMRQRQKSQRRSNTRANDPQFVVTARRKPAQTSAHIANGLPIRLQRKPDIWRHEIIAARMIRNRAPVVIRQAHPQRGNPQSSAAIGRRPLARATWHSIARSPPLPGRYCGREKIAREPYCSQATPIQSRLVNVSTPDSPTSLARRRELKILRSTRAKPCVAGAQSLIHKLIQKPARIGIVRAPADILKPPTKRQRLAIFFIRPAAMLVCPDFLLIPFAYHQAIEYSLARANQRMPKR